MSFIISHPRLAILACALLLRLIWVATVPDRLVWIDEREYAQIAQHLVRGEGYVSNSARANPILPLYLAGALKLFGPHYTAPRVGQAIIGALTCVLIYQIAALLISATAGLLSGLLLALYPPHIYTAGVFYVDAWSIFLFSLCVYLAVRTLQAGSHLGLALLCGITLGITALTRETFLTCGLAIAGWWLYARPLAWRRNLVACAVMAGGCMLTILPWSVRNYVVYDRPLLISAGFYTMLWRGNNELATGGPEDRTFMWNTPAWRERLARLPENERRVLEARYQAIDRLVIEREAQLGDPVLATDEVLKPVAIDAIVSHPLRTAERMLKKVRTLFDAFSPTESQNQFTTRRNSLVAAFSFYPILVLAFIGAVLAFPRRRELAIIFFLILVIVFDYALLTACTRFRLPLDPYLIMLASLSLQTGWLAVSGKWRDYHAALRAQPAAAGSGQMGGCP